MVRATCGEAELYDQRNIDGRKELERRLIKEAEDVGVLAGAEARRCRGRIRKEAA